MRFRQTKGVTGWLAAKFRLYRNIRINLDARGSFFWRQINGQRSLREIDAVLREEFELTDEESKKATLVFTKQLMLRHLIVLDVGEVAQ